MLRLKTLLQYNYIYYILIIISLLTSILKVNNNSKYNINITNINGIVTKIKEKENINIIEVKGLEKVIVYTKDKVNLGDKINIEGKLSIPNQNTIPNTFNYKKYLNNHNIYFIMKAEKINIIKENQNILYKIKTKLTSRISNYKTYKELNAFIMGDTSLLEDDDYYNYQKNGIVHMFSIGSMQIKIVSILILYMLSKVKIKEIFKYILLFLFLISFIFILNQSASVIRSLLFYIMITINKKKDFNISTKNILLLTISVLIIINPKIIFDTGFQYSCASSYGLIISIDKRKVNYFKKILKASMIATLYSLPITLINNYEINILAPINNLIFMPLITLIVFPISFLTILIPYLEPVYKIIINIVSLLNNTIGSINMFNIIIPKVNNYLYLIYYILLILFTHSKNKKYLTAALLFILSFKLKPLIDNNTYIYFLDIGQGDSTLIYNKKEVILIDTGGNYNYAVSNNSILMIKSLGINKIDLLLLTHGDADHMKDAPNIIKKLKVKNVMMNQNEYNDLEKEVLKTKVNIVNNYKSKMNFKIYNEFIGIDENTSSIMSHLTINKTKILFLGDASKNEELLLYDKYKIKTDIVKLAHHGSKTSSDKNFLKNIEAKEAIISSGRNNLYKHPSLETINSLNELKIKYLNTADSGTIKYTFNKNNYKITLYKP